MTDPSSSNVRPDRATVELALRVAEREVVGEPCQSYWHGAIDALRWALGHVDVAPVTRRLIRVDLEEPRRATVYGEAERTYECMRGGRLRVDVGLRYLTGVENTCAWVATGSGFAQPLDREWLREHLGVE
jgi:hypothetical protein